MSERLLIIDDEPQIQRLLRLILEDAGYQVHVADRGDLGLLEAAHLRPDAILLDLGLPDRDGLEILRDLRSWSKVPVIILSIRDDGEDKVKGLDLGADDYITKPFHGAELLARLRAVLRRVPDFADMPVFRAGPLEVDFVSRNVRRNGEDVHLTATEFALLKVLIQHAGRVVTQAQLLRQVWGPNAAEQSHYLRVHFTHLRQKIDPDRTGLIKTEPRIGYRLEAPAD